MKKTILILLVLILATFTIIAADSDKTIEIKANVAEYSVFGVSLTELSHDTFKSVALFESAIKSSVEKSIDILDLKGRVGVGYVSGINNTSNAVKIFVTTSDLVSGNNTIGLKVVSAYNVFIPAASNSEYGKLKNSLLVVQEKIPGTAALAPAGSYEATLTVSLTAK